jgi:hypothetical protein
MTTGLGVKGFFDLFPKENEIEEEFWRAKII